MNTPDQAIGRRHFTDGAERAIFEDYQGGQYVLDDVGQRVEGVWLPPADESDVPLIVVVPAP
jgi:hypothetical protein